MKQKYLIFMIVLHLAKPSQGENKPNVVGARTKSMAEMSVAVIDFWSVHNNQAVMPFFGKLAGGIFYENRFLLKETSTAVFGLCLPANKAGYFGLNMNYFGGKNYGELKAGLAYAMSFAHVFAVGLQFDYLLNRFGSSAYPSRHGFSFEIGLYGQVNKRLSLGFHASNPARLRMQTYNDVKEYIPTVLRLGANYKFDSQCLLGIELVKNLETKIQASIGTEYAFADYLLLRGGVRIPDFEFSLGVGTKVKELYIDFASSYHVNLGYSPQISVYYIVKKHVD